MADPADAMWYNGSDPAKNHGVDRTYVVQRRDELWQAFVSTGKAVAAFVAHEYSYARALLAPTYDPRFARA